MKKLEEIHCKEAMRLLDFPQEVVNAKPFVAVVLTQSWCPQWHWMKAFLEGISREDTEIWYTEYDREPWFDEFMNFKERVFKNDQVPYVRYYSEGKLRKTGNYMGQSGFESTLWPR